MKKIKATEAVAANIKTLAEYIELGKAAKKAKEDLKGFQQENLADLLNGVQVGKYVVSVKPKFEWSVIEA